MNWLLYSQIDDLKENDGVGLLEVGSCGLHIMHNAFRKVCETTETHTFPLKFCTHRWLENVAAADKALDLLPSLKLYLKAIEEKKFNKPVCKSFQTVKECLSDPFLPCQRSFFASQARQVELFLLKYQADKPLMPLLACDLQDMIQRLLSRFIKSKTLDSCSTAGRLIHLDVSSVADHVQPAKIEQGLNTDSQLIKVKNTKAVSERMCSFFKWNARTF